MNDAERFRQFCLTTRLDDGSPFVLLPWQLEWADGVFGRIDPETGLRITRTSFLFIPRKNGKTMLNAAAGLFCLVGDEEPYPEVYCAAHDIAQAGRSVEYAKRLRESNPQLKAMTKLYKHPFRIECPPNAQTHPTCLLYTSPSPRD